jgi:hypothetical protein
LVAHHFPAIAPHPFCHYVFDASHADLVQVCSRSGDNPGAEGSVMCDTIPQCPRNSWRLSLSSWLRTWVSAFLPLSANDVAAPAAFPTLFNGLPRAAI